MKRNLFFLIIVSAIVSITLISCEDNVQGTLPEIGDGVHAAFASKIQNVDLIPADGNQIKVPVYRGGNSSVEANVAIAMTTASNVPAGLFTLSNPTVNFPVGEHIAYAIITFPSQNLLSPGALYNITLTITDEAQLSVSEVKEIRVAVQRKLTFNPIGTGSLYSEWDETVYSVPVQLAEEAPVYRMISPYISGYNIIFSVAPDNKITYEKQHSGYVSGTYGIISFTMPRASYEQPYRDGNTFYLIPEFTVAAGSYGQWEEVLVLP